MTMNFIADPKTICASFYEFQKLKTWKKKFKMRIFVSNFVKIWFYMIFEFYKISSKEFMEERRGLKLGRLSALAPSKSFEFPQNPQRWWNKNPLNFSNLQKLGM